MSRPRVEVRIGTLVMQGVEAADRPRLRRAIERELASRLATAAARLPGRRPPGARAAIAIVQGGTLAVTPGHAPDAIGRRIGHAVRGVMLGLDPARHAQRD